MHEKIQLKHPEGKKAIKMDPGKYELLKTSLISFLKSNQGATHDEMCQAVTKDFEEKKVKFEGSVGWHLEWVKLDLEARKEIKRSGEKSPIKYSLLK
jgi:hypothetical protein